MVSTQSVKSRMFSEHPERDSTYMQMKPIDLNVNSSSSSSSNNMSIKGRGCGDQLASSDPINIPGFRDKMSTYNRRKLRSSQNNFRMVPPYLNVTDVSAKKKTEEDSTSDSSAKSTFAPLPPPLPPKSVSEEYNVTSHVNRRSTSRSTNSQRSNSQSSNSSDHSHDGKRFRISSSGVSDRGDVFDREYSVVKEKWTVNDLGDKPDLQVSAPEPTVTSPEGNHQYMIKLDDITCKKCDCILDSVSTCSACKKNFCSSCKWSKKCPLCGEIGKLDNNVAGNRLISQKFIKCQTCNEKVLIAKYKEHTSLSFGDSCLTDSYSSACSCSASSCSSSPATKPCKGACGKYTKANDMVSWMTSKGATTSCYSQDSFSPTKLCRIQSTLSLSSSSESLITYDACPLNVNTVLCRIGPNIYFTDNAKTIYTEEVGTERYGYVFKFSVYPCGYHLNSPASEGTMKRNRKDGAVVMGTLVNKSWYSTLPFPFSGRIKVEVLPNMVLYKGQKLLPAQVKNYSKEINFSRPKGLVPYHPVFQQVFDCRVTEKDYYDHDGYIFLKFTVER